MRNSGIETFVMVGLFVATAIAGCDEETQGAVDTGGSKAKEESAASEESKRKAAREESGAEPSAGADAAGAVADPALLEPGRAGGRAPETFEVRFETTEGPFVAKFHREWAPHGVDRFHHLAKIGYYDGVAFFRVIDGFMAQFGLHGNPKVNEAWTGETIPDDPVEKSNERGYVSFAKRPQPDSRTTQLFINYSDNSKLDDRGFAPIGKVVEGMDVVDELHAGYGGDVSQKKLRNRGNDYLKEEFPELDYIESTEIVSKKKGGETDESAGSDGKGGAE